MASTNKKILEEIHPLSIIREVQKWPVLYVKDNRDRFRSKTKVWNEIAKELFADWDTYSDFEKESRVSGLIKKWRNLRDTFKRDLETEKKIRAGHNIKKKTYVYLKNMLFLLPHVTMSESDTVVEPELNEFFKKSAKEKAVVKKSMKKKRRTEKQTTFQSIIIPETSSQSRDVTEELIDEDKHFLMSLVPSFKRMNDDEKLEAKLEILKVLKGMRKKTQNNHDSLEYSTVAESLSYNFENTDYNPVKMEMISANEELEDRQTIRFESEDNDNSD